MQSASPASSDSETRSSSPSTAPSTPTASSIPTYYLIHKTIDAASLAALPAWKSSGDRILLFSGKGPLKPLLQEAAVVLDDKTLLDPAKWDKVVADDYECLATRSDLPPLEDSQPTADVGELIADCPKLSHASALNLFSEAGLRTVLTLPAPSSNSSLTLHILERPALTFPLLSHTPATPLNPTAHPYSLPSLECLQRAWAVWDLISLGMIPPVLLHSKPIDLRHKPLFYIGHLPTFANLLLSKLLKLTPAGPRSFLTTFERGIDPHIDDPDHCHPHSEVPEKDEDWPALGEVLTYRDDVRARVAQIYAELEAGARPLTRRLARTLMMVHEHDGFHIETLLYMLIQRAGAGMLPPPGFALPPWEHLAAQWDATPAPSTPHATLGPCTLTLGHDDAESADPTTPFSPTHTLGWDNESPARTVSVGAFRVDWRPVTNGEYAAFWAGPGAGAVDAPKSWVVGQDGEVSVRTLYGAVPLRVARHWPVLAAYDDLRAYAAWKGGRIPSEPELRLFLDTYQVRYDEGSNTGFRNWHPLPATAGMDENGGRGSNGGVWEWTSTTFDTHEGFDGTTIFPGYSSDFFDTKHQVVIGASYATIPRLGDRSTVRNFYQHNYPYPWVGARVAYDV